MIPIDYNASVYAFCSKSRIVTRYVNPSMDDKAEAGQKIAVNNFHQCLSYEIHFGPRLTAYGLNFFRIFKSGSGIHLNIIHAYICLTSVTRAKPKEKMEFPA